MYNYITRKLSEQGQITKKCIAMHTNTYDFNFKLPLYSSALEMKLINSSIERYFMPNVLLRN